MVMNRLHGWRQACALALVSFLFLPTTAAAQGGTSGLVGTVADQQAAAIPGAMVILTSAATGAVRETVTGPTGATSSCRCRPARTRCGWSSRASGPSSPRGCSSRSTRPQRLDVKMEIGGIAETVQVTAETTVVNTTDSSLGNVIAGTQIRELPLEGRNVVGLLSLQPGVVYVPPTAGSPTRARARSAARAPTSRTSRSTASTSTTTSSRTPSRRCCASRSTRCRSSA
jgi:hypothetical protein